MNCKGCRRELRWQSVKLKLDKCRQCRQADRKLRARMTETYVGRLAGEAIWQAIK